MIELDIIQKENQIAFNELYLEISMVNNSHIFTESSSSDNIIQKFIKKIKEIIDRTKEKINELLLKHKIKEIEKMVEKNPDLAKRTIYLPDYEKLHNLNMDTYEKILANKQKNDMVMYENRRKKLMGATAGITITLSAAIALLYKQLKNARSENFQLGEYIQKLSSKSDPLFKSIYADDAENRAIELQKKILMNGEKIVKNDMDDMVKLTNHIISDCKVIESYTSGINDVIVSDERRAVDTIIYLHSRRNPNRSNKKGNKL